MHIGGGTIVGRRKEPEERKSRILKAAEELFSQDGFRSTSVDRIAERAGEAKGSVYFYFHSKGNLYLMILLNASDAIVGEMERAAMENLAADEKLANVGRAYILYLLEHPQYFRMLMFLQQGEWRKAISDSLFDQLNDKARLGIKIVSDLIETGIEQGVLTRTHPWRAAKIMVAMWNGIIHLALGEEALRSKRIEVAHFTELPFDLLNNGLIQRQSWVSPERR